MIAWVKCLGMGLVGRSAELGELAALLDRAAQLLCHPALQDATGARRVAFYERLDVLLDMTSTKDPRAVADGAGFELG